MFIKIGNSMALENHPKMRFLGIKNFEILDFKKFNHVK